MSCDRCENIHEAQRTGRTNRSCECECHYCSSDGANITNPIFYDNVDATGGATLAFPTIIDNSGAIETNY